ncbi:MAG TPA: hypothetical protein VEX68_28845, partial [Bryobacteraceae bacterium]|nr:hypothetical protein [Bryobacteraceae bacterium]
MNQVNISQMLMSAVLFLGASAEARNFAIGLTRAGEPIGAVEIPAASQTAPLVVLMSNLESDLVAEYQAIPQNRRRFRLIAIPTANMKLAFPPTGVAYKENTESHYLWRWIGTHAPDLVLVAGDDWGLIGALGGNVPARHIEPSQRLLNAVGNLKPSEARKEMDRRLRRTPVQLANELEPHYGHEWPQAVYVPGMALIGRMRLGYTKDVQRIVAPFLAGQDPLDKPTGSHFAGHLVFAELAERTGDRRYVELVRRAADFGFEA